MKAFIADAQWEPRGNTTLTPEETKIQRAVCGSQAWKNPKFSLQKRDVPALGDHDVLVEVKRCGLCGSDTHIFETDDQGYIIFSGPVKLPCILGHEYSGVVADIGKSVTEFQKGDPVTAESVIWCGCCTPCRSGMPNQCSHAELAGITVNGALANYTAVNERQLWNLEALTHHHNDEDTFNLGALIEPVGCAYNGLFVVGRGFLPGATIVVYGAGPIGLGAIALASLAGAGQVIVFDRIAERLEIASQLGDVHTFDLTILENSGISPKETVLELTRGKGADIQVEAAGSAHLTLPEMEASMAVNGTIVYLGRTGRSASLMLDVFVTGANGIVGARGHAGYGIFPNIITLIAENRLQLNSIITSHFPLAKVMSALEASTTRKDGKIMIDITP